jgi:hypothetical protein
VLEQEMQNFLAGIGADEWHAAVLPSLAPKVGSRIRFQLYMGIEVDRVIRAILKTTSEVRYRVEHGNGPYMATIRPEQIV